MPSASLACGTTKVFDRHKTINQATTKSDGAAEGHTCHSLIFMFSMACAVIRQYVTPSNCAFLDNLAGTALHWSTIIADG